MKCNVFDKYSKTVDLSFNGLSGVNSFEEFMISSEDFMYQNLLATTMRM